jgi:hypothetical protein
VHATAHRRAAHAALGEVEACVWEPHPGIGDTLAPGGIDMQPVAAGPGAEVDGACNPSTMRLPPTVFTLQVRPTRSKQQCTLFDAAVAC